MSKSEGLSLAWMAALFTGLIFTDAHVSTYVIVYVTSLTGYLAGLNHDPK